MFRVGSVRALCACRMRNCHCDPHRLVDVAQRHCAMENPPLRGQPAAPDDGAHGGQRPDDLLVGHAGDRDPCRRPGVAGRFSVSRTDRLLPFCRRAGHAGIAGRCVRSIRTRRGLLMPCAGNIRRARSPAASSPRVRLSRIPRLRSCSVALSSSKAGPCATSWRGM